jgi:hypothetical protein
MDPSMPPTAKSSPFENGTSGVTNFLHSIVRRRPHSGVPDLGPGSFSSTYTLPDLLAHRVYGTDATTRHPGLARLLIR